MAYATITEVKIILANALTSGNPSAAGPQPITSIGTSLTSTVPNETFYQMIRWADQQIDSAISNVYKVPLRRVNLETFHLEVDVTAGDGTVTPLVIDDTSKLLPEDIILIREGVSYQQLTVATIISNNQFTVTTPVTDSYLASMASIEKIGFPVPIALISSKLAAGSLYDKYFAAQVDGNKSEYGMKLRTEAMDDLNSILSGSAELTVADANILKGRRFYNPAVDDFISTKAEPKDFRKGSN